MVRRIRKPRKASVLTKTQTGADLRGGPQPSFSFIFERKKSIICLENGSFNFLCFRGLAGEGEDGLRSGPPLIRRPISWTKRSRLYSLPDLNTH